MAKQFLSAKLHRPATVLLIALWFGLMTGVGELVIRGVQKFVLHKLIYVSRDVVWMAPLADVSIFLIVGALLYLLARKWPKFISFRTAVLVFAFLSFLGPLLWFPRLHPYAGVILAVGLAAQTARIVTAHPDIFAFLVHRTTGWMAALVVVMGLTLHGWQALAEYQAIKSLPPAPKNAPNVLFIVLDTVRAQSLSLYGYERPTTPNLERLAKQGVVFERAIATAPWTLTSHASMFTGRFPHELSADWLKPLDSTYPTIAEVFQARGYMTAGFVANFLYCTYESGLDRGFIHYQDYPISWQTIAKSSWLARTLTRQNSIRNTADEVTGAFTRWFSQKNERPFFVFLNYMEAHEPYIPPSPFDLKFAPELPEEPFVRDDRRYTSQEIEKYKNAYDGAIAFLDHHVSLLLAEIEKKGLLKDTLVIITSDHGEEFGEHGLMGHGSSLYSPALHVPLLISFPGHVPSGKRVRELVTLRDIPATVLELLKIDPRFPGTSLARHWARSSKRTNGTESPLFSEVRFASGLPDWHPITRGDMKSLFMDRRHYIMTGDGREELYDLETDPLEQNDLVASEKGRGRLDHFRKSLEDILRRNGNNGSEAEILPVSK